MGRLQSAHFKMQEKGKEKRLHEGLKTGRKICNSEKDYRINCSPKK